MEQEKQNDHYFDFNNKVKNKTKNITLSKHFLNPIQNSQKRRQNRYP